MAEMMENRDVKVRSMRLMQFYKPTWPVPYCVFYFRMPKDVVYSQPPECATVLAQEPVLGEYLESDIQGKPYPYIDFLPKGRTTPGSKSYTEIGRVRMNIGHLESADLYIDKKAITTWDLDYQPVIIMERGVVFAVIETCLSRDRLTVRSLHPYPITLKSAFEST